MTDSNRSMNDVHALVEERRRYEAWLEALDGRRDTTPAHVFERVQADYRSRLEQVANRLASHRQTIEDERASVMSRLSLLGAEEQMRRDERAELDLRAHVGELAEADAASAFSAVDEAMQLLAGEKGELERRVADLDALLAEQPVATGPRAPAADVTEAPAVVAEVESEPASPRASGGVRTPSFDEMAFLDAVVGEKPADETNPSPAPVSEPVYERIVTPDESDAESLLEGLGGAKRADATPPLAANVPSNTPIALRTSGAIEQSKTLKCNECGAMNYPTEWYCERCGAELAAL
jgi:hypothetical protein